MPKTFNRTALGSLSFTGQCPYSARVRISTYYSKGYRPEQQKSEDTALTVYDGGKGEMVWILNEELTLT